MHRDLSDVFLIPRVVSKIRSRDDVKVHVKMGRIDLTCPIIASPMKDVCDGPVVGEMHRLGGLGIIHRFSSIEDQVKEYKRHSCGACAIGVGEDYYERFCRLHQAGCQIFCIDVANGASVLVEEVTTKLSNYSVDLIVGNVASAACYNWVQKLPNVRAVRVGIASGAACTTKNATGICSGTFSVIQECASVKNGTTLLIADGGIKEPQDFCKVIAAGADVVMLGSSIAATIDSPAEVITKDGKQYKVYHGSASFDVQKTYRETPRYIEGKTRLLDYTGETLEQLCGRFMDGLKSSMSYFDAEHLLRYRNNASFSFRN